MSLSLLIAESDTKLCNLYEDWLTEEGYDVTIASDGLDCLDKLRGALPAAIVLDLELRWGGGDGVLAWLREERSAHATPIIATVPAVYPRDALKRILTPEIDHLPKPFELPDLVKKIRTAVATKYPDGWAKPACDSCNRHSLTSGLPENSSKIQSIKDQLILPDCKQPYDEQGARQATDSPPAQSLQDIELAARIKDALGVTGYRPLRDIDVAVLAGIVYLVGYVPSYYLKQIAQVTAKAVPGIHRIHNGLQVVQPS